MVEDLVEVASVLEAAVEPSRRFQRAIVLKETASTQDAAALFGAGCIVVAGRQTAGRGRVGRQWSDGDGNGLAMTFAVAAGERARMSIAAGVAAARAIESVLGQGVGLKWPNDVVERDGAQRKLAGVLIECRAHVTLIGIGINVGQRSWPRELNGRAVSIAELGNGGTRAQVGAELIRELDAVLELSEAEIVHEWRCRDTVTGTHRTVQSAGITYHGIVEDLDPLRLLTLRCESGLIQLPLDTLVMERVSNA